MELISLPDASRIAEVSVTTLRNYIRDKQLAAVFGPKRLTPQGVGTTALDLAPGAATRRGAAGHRPARHESC